MNIGIFIFRRDLRLYDNIGLLNTIKNVDLIIPIFILDSKQIKKNKKNQYYFSNNAVQFLCESIIDLNSELIKYKSYLRLYYGKPYKIVNKLIKWILTKYTINNLYLGYNKDYSIYSLKRDNKINKICCKNKVKLIITETDYLLIPFKNIIKQDNSSYKQFSAFYKNAIKFEVNKPKKNNFNNFLHYNIITKSEYNIQNIHSFYNKNNNLSQNGGRINGKKNLDNLKIFSNYNDLRNRLDYTTTNLSAYLNFGCISIRETYYKMKNKLGENTELIRQLYWRDYYLQLLVFTNKGNEYTHIDDRYNNIKWKNNKSDWLTLINSQTGFLLIDAAMNQLKISGYMHNRARLLVGVFWTKYLLINIFHNIYGSQVGFSKYLVDAVGPSQNKMNHQWITELDLSGRKYAPKNHYIAGRPMDISNKNIKKYDPECIYIKKWLPHLANIPNKNLINWDIMYTNAHPKPIFNSKKKYLEWINLCKNKE